MKRTIQFIAVALLILFGFSCQKSSPEREQHLLDSHIQSIVKNGDTTRFTYANSSLTLTVVNHNEEAAQLTLHDNGKELKILATLSPAGEGYKTFTMLSENNEPYLSLRIDKNKAIDNLHEYAEFPIDKLIQHSAIQVVSPFTDCLNNAVKQCNKEWACYLVCELSLAQLAGCMVGWIPACKLGLLPVSGN